MNQQNKWVVCKFGGTSVSSELSLDNLSSIVDGHIENGYKVLVVASALSGVSNMLEHFCSAPKGTLVDPLVTNFRQIHQQWMSVSGVECSVDNVLGEYLQSLESNARALATAASDIRLAKQAEIMATGELASTRLLLERLSRQFGEKVAVADSRHHLQAQVSDEQSLDDHYLNAFCSVKYDLKVDESMSDKGQIVVAQGFIASNAFRQTVLLGRGGSDTSAAYFAVLLGAERLEIWTDVPGMFSANPKLIPQARQLLKLDYREAQEIASTGGKVLHPRCLRPARQAGLEVFVGSAFAPEQGGTLIAAGLQSEPQVKAISVRDGVTLVAMETADMWQRPGFLAEAFTIFARLGLSIDQVSTSETNVTVTLDNLTQQLSDDKLDQLAEELQSICRVTVIRDAAAVSIVGREIRTMLPKLSSAFGVFQNRSVHMLTQAANNLNFTFVVDHSESNQLVQHIHQSLISQNQLSEFFGPTWEEITGQTSRLLEKMASSRWWYNRTEELSNIVAEQASYVYSRSKVQAQIKKLQTLSSIDQVFYAMKANSHPDILNEVYKGGLGFECVSIYEVERVMRLFPDLDKKKILFTPNFAARSEYQKALELKINLTLDNLYPLLEWGDDFIGAEVLLRVDTGSGKGHHEHVKTAGAEAKFGIPISDIRKHLGAFAKKDITIIGLHCHVGSGILSSDNWYNNGSILGELLADLPDVRILDLGGGLGIVEKPDQSELLLDEVDQSIKSLKQRLGNIQLWLEPGRFIVAESGVLLARVTQLKVKGKAGYMGIETGMNALIRPALYGAYHPIYNITRLNQVASHHYTVVGPICETGDKLGVDRLMPEAHSGDAILIDNVGAYGRVMGSSYNLRQPPREVVVD